MPSLKESLKENAKKAVDWLNPPSPPGRRRFFEGMAIAGAGLGVAECNRRLGGERLTPLIRNSVGLFGGYRIVQRGETLGQITLQYYGDSSLFSWLATANEITNPNWLRVGHRLYLPPAAGRNPTHFTIENSLSAQLQRRDLLANGQWQPEVPYAEWPFWHPPFSRMIFIHRDGLELAGLPKQGTKVDVFENWQHDRPVLTGRFIDNGVVVNREALNWGSRLWTRCAYDPTRMVLATCHPVGDRSENPAQRLVFSIQLYP